MRLGRGVLVELRVGLLGYRRVFSPYPLGLMTLIKCTSGLGFHSLAPLRARPPITNASTVYMLENRSNLSGPRIPLIGPPARPSTCQP